jgi:hypothetical protein
MYGTLKPCFLVDLCSTKKNQECSCRLYVNKCCVGRKEGNEEKGNRGGGEAQTGQFALSKRPARMGIRCLIRRAAIPSKGFSLHNELMHALNIITCNTCIFDIKDKYSPCEC